MRHARQLRRLCGATTLVVASLLSACAAGQFREVPTNPLRARSATTRVADDIWAATPEEYLSRSAIQQAQALENLPSPQPRSVVPPDLGADPDSLEERWQPTPILQEEWPVHGDEYSAATHSWLQPWFSHTDPNDPRRHIGLGHPLVGTSWRNRPVYFGLFLGGIISDDPIDNRVQQNNGAIGGGRLGWDFDHYWGLEGRYAYSRVNIANNVGLPLDDSHNSFTDVSLLYYPWGDARWRPFVGAGIGLATFRFHDDADRRITDSLFTMPIGGGLKYYYSNAFTLRFEAYDNISIGDNTLDSMHNFSLSLGFELRFGSRSPSYFPWHGNTVIW